MVRENLEYAIQRAGNPVDLLRHSQAGAYAFPIKSEFSNWRDEQRAWNTTAVLFDQSHHMTDFYFTGPDVRRLLSDVGVNSFRTFGKNKAKQLVVCNYDGYVIGDAILFGLADDMVSIVGRPAVPNWVAFQAETGDYDVEVRRDERSVANVSARTTFRYQLQGPKALDIIEKASDGTLPRIKFFNIGEFTIAGHTVRALNHTMVGVPGLEKTGLEMWGPAEHGPAVLHALLSAGADFGLRQGGSRAYSTTAIESGWIASPTPAIYSGERMRPYRQWLPATGWEATASLGGSFVSDDIEDYYLTPWDLGYGHLVKFDHDFIGRTALEHLVDQPHRRKVWLRWKDDDAQRVIAGSLFGGTQRAKYLELPSANYATLPFDRVLIDDQLVGLATYTGYTVNVGGLFSLAMIEEAQAHDGAEVTLVWGEENGGSSKPTVERHVQTTIQATISTQPLI